MRKSSASIAGSRLLWYPKNVIFLCKLGYIGEKGGAEGVICAFQTCLSNKGYLPFCNEALDAEGMFLS